MKEEKPAAGTPWMDTVRAGEYLGVRPKTLEVWRCNGKGPKHYFVGDRLVRYRVEDLDAFARAESSPGGDR